MDRPVIVAVEQDPGAESMVGDELRRRYGMDYEVVCVASAESALGELGRVRKATGLVAVVLADVSLMDGSGLELLSRVHELHPQARRVLMVRWGERTAAEPILRAHAVGQIDDWIAKPWTYGDEHFHQGVATFLYEWARQHRAGFEVIQVVGDRWSARSHEIRDMLSRNSVLFGFHDTRSDQGQAMLEQIAADRRELPVVVAFDGQVLPNPSNAQIAEVLGIRTRPSRTSYDVTVIGAGPAGLAAAVSAASEGLRTVVLEHEAIGGQAATSSLIRNYLGFPRGVSGTELAVRAFQQAGMFGADFVYGRATGLRIDGSRRVVSIGDDGEIASRAVIVATGVAYRRLDIPALEARLGSGVFYGAAASEAAAMTGRQVFVVGGANSAGQAAVHLAKYAAQVTLLVRGASLTNTMSNYLTRQIDAANNIAVRHHCEVIDAHGDGRLTGLVLRSRTSGATEAVPAEALFVLIGAEPHTGWLPADLQRDRRGFILTSTDLLRLGSTPAQWPEVRSPLPFESSIPGVFAVGDVRYGSTKRVASSVGEGSVAVRLLHEYLSQF
jgi:thioredoxin reductase (NADPH)